MDVYKKKSILKNLLRRYVIWEKKNQFEVYFFPCVRHIRVHFFF